MFLQSGQIFGRYKILERIGQGGMAVVYKAFDPTLKRDVAIKIIRTGAFPPEGLERAFVRFEREAKMLARLDHANIVKVLDYGDSDGAPYLVMEYLKGVTLRGVRKPMTVDNAVKLVRPIVDALAYIHEQGMLHRDVKPSNIMFTEDERVVLMDFGIAKWVESSGEQANLTATGFGIGTPEYMAPEQCLGKKVDRRADEYALAIVFYELITGMKPFRGSTPIEVLTKQAVETFPDPRDHVPELNPSVKRFFDCALAKNPDARYATAEDFLRDLDGLRMQAIADRAKVTGGKSFLSSEPQSRRRFLDFLSIMKFHSIRKIFPGVAAILCGIATVYLSLSSSRANLLSGTIVQTEAATIGQTVPPTPADVQADVIRLITAPTIAHNFYRQTLESAMAQALDVRETLAVVQMSMAESSAAEPASIPSVTHLSAVASVEFTAAITALPVSIPTLDPECSPWLPPGETGVLTSFYGNQIAVDNPMTPNRIIGSMAVIEPPMSANMGDWDIMVVDYRQKWIGGGNTDQIRYPCSWIDRRIHCGPFDFYYSALTDNADYAYDSYRSSVLVFPKGKDCNVYEASIPYYLFNQTRTALFESKSNNGRLTGKSDTEDSHEDGDPAVAWGSDGNISDTGTSHGVDVGYTTKPENYEYQENIDVAEYLTKP